MIKVYSKPNCPFCDKAKDYLKENDMSFEEIDVTKNSDALAFIKGQGHTTVPQLYKDDTLLVEGGYNGLVSANKDVLKQIINS